MNVYDIYEDKKGNTHLVKGGFCWPGLFFAWLWTAIRGMYGIAVVQFVAWLLFGLIGLSFWYNLNWLYLMAPFADLSQISPYVFQGLAITFWFLMVVVHIYVGVFCNNWIRSKWDNRGWLRKSNILASSKKTASEKISRLK